MLNNTARVIAKAVVVLGICVIAVGIVMRIAWVNDTALKLPAVETHEMHENVSFDGAFLSFASENTSGYSVNVTNAEKMSYNEYIERYGLDKSKTFEGLDSLSLICLEIEVGNIGNSDGGIFLFECNLVPERKNTYYIADTSCSAGKDCEPECAVASHGAGSDGGTSSTANCTGATSSGHEIGRASCRERV